ncbi:MAG: right-handed parallel beta-helix repeat-containing protein, partial [Candidatus Saccharimonadales bacterium]
EGMVYYDTDTDKLEVYSNGKWQADRTDAVLIAASNSSQSDKDAADYVADGNTGTAADGDQVQINSALTAGSGKKVVLLAGTYTIDDYIAIPNGTVLSGVGNGSLVTLPSSYNTSISMILNADSTTGSGVIIENLRVDGNATNQTSGTMIGIDLDGLGGGSGLSARLGGKVLHTVVTNMRADGILLQNSSNSTVSGNSATSNGGSGVRLLNTNRSVVSDNVSNENDYNGVHLNTSSNNVVSNNVAQANDGDGISLTSTANTNTISDNVFQSNLSNGINLANSSNSTISGNTITGSVVYGILLDTNSNNNIVSANQVQDSGGATTNNGIFLYSADSNQVANNKITDASATSNNYAIVVYDATVDALYLSNNTLGGGTINDAGTGTIYVSQISSTGILTNRATGFAIQSSTGTNILSNDSTTSVTIGATDTTGTLFVLDTKTGAGDPTGIAGGMYYNSNTGKFRCYQGAVWADCITASASTTLQDAYNNSASPALITTTAAKTVKIAAGAAPTANLFSVDNAGFATVTDNANGIAVNYVGGAAAVQGAGARIDLTPGTTTGGTWSGLRVVANGTGAVSGVTEYGIKLEGPGTPGAGTETGMYIGTGWDTGLDVQSGGLNLAGYTTGGNPDDPPTPATGNLRVYAKSVAGRMMLKWKGPSGVDTSLQTNFGFNTISMWYPNNGSTGTSLGFGMLWPTATGTISHPTPTSTNFGTSIRTMQLTNVVTTQNQTLGFTSNVVAQQNFWRGNAAGLGGFFMQTRFKTTLVPAATHRLFVGLSSMTTAPVAADTVTGDTAGLSHITTDNITTMAFMTRDNT